MAGCMSTPSKTIKSRNKHCQRVIKRHRKATRSASDGARVSDYAVSEFVHVDFENGATATHRRSQVSNSTFHLTQLQRHQSQFDSNAVGNIDTSGTSMFEEVKRVINWRAWMG
ncbi:unnamed protein product [Prunus armeniaca]